VRAHIYGGETTFYTIGGRCRELSEGGAGAALHEQLPTGEVVALELSPSLRLYAAVRYLHGFYHGFEFVMLRDRQRQALHQLCASLAPRHKTAVHA
jgi:hypothetical protein